MGATNVNGIPFPELTDAPNGPLQLQAQANWLEAFLVTGVGAWTSWTPVVTQGAGVSVTNTRSRYLKWGRLVIAKFLVTCGSSGTSGQNVAISTPVAPADINDLTGGFLLFDTSATINYIGIAYPLSSTTFGGAVSGQAAVVGNTPTLALASGDVLRGYVIYESAS